MLSILAALACAAPMQIEHSARVLDVSGAPLSGVHTVTTRLFDANEDGTQLWQNSATVTATDGYFSVALAGGTPDLSTDVFNHPQVWLEVQIDGGDPMTPRTRLSSVPYALDAEHAALADVANRVVLEPGSGTGPCVDGTIGFDEDSQQLRVCSNSAWVTISGSGTAVGTAENPAASCQAVLDANPGAVDSTYYIDPDGAGAQAPYAVYCDMLGTQAWALVYLMCQDSPGDIFSLDHNFPVLPTTAGPASVPYATVAAMNPSTVRFTSDFTGGTGYLFDWSTAVAGVNHMETLLEGLTRSINVCQPMGQPIAGSSGVSCSMSWQHNNNGSEGHDIPTLGCPCAVWSVGDDGMQWGQIDGRGNYNGVSHHTATSWDHSPMTTNGCIQTYVR